MDLILEQLRNRKEKSDLIDLNEASELLKMSTSSIYKMSALKTIRVKKRLGARKLIFGRNDLNEWINAPASLNVSIADDYLHKNLGVNKVQYN